MSAPRALRHTDRPRAIATHDTVSFERQPLDDQPTARHITHQLYALIGAAVCGVMIGVGFRGVDWFGVLGLGALIAVVGVSLRENTAWESDRR